MCARSDTCSARHSAWPEVARQTVHVACAACVLNQRTRRPLTAQPRTSEGRVMWRRTLSFLAHGLARSHWRAASMHALCHGPGGASDYMGFERCRGARTGRHEYATCVEGRSHFAFCTEQELASSRSLAASFADHHVGAATCARRYANDCSSVSACATRSRLFPTACSDSRRYTLSRRSDVSLDDPWRPAHCRRAMDDAKRSVAYGHRGSGGWP